MGELSLTLDNKQLNLSLPESILSSNVSELKSAFFDQLNVLKLDDVSTVNIIFRETRQIDSLGLNFIVSIIQWAEEKDHKVLANVYSDRIFKILDDVWLTRKMEVSRLN